MSLTHEDQDRLLIFIDSTINIIPVQFTGKSFFVELYLLVLQWCLSRLLKYT